MSFELVGLKSLCFVTTRRIELQNNPPVTLMYFGGMLFEERCPRVVCVGRFGGNVSWGMGFDCCVGSFCVGRSRGLAS